MPERKRWPTVQEVGDHAKRGLIDDRTSGLTPLDFSEEEWGAIMADVYAELARTPNRARLLGILGSPKSAALVEKLITAQSPDEIEAASHAAEACLLDHPDDHAVASAYRYLTRPVTASAVGQQSSGERS